MTYVSLRLKVLSILAVFSIFILAACSVPSSPQLFIAEKTMLVEVGEQRTLNFTTSFPLDDLTWTSSNPEVVSVVGGRITALKEGTSTIQVTADTGRIFDSVLITVIERATTPEPPVEPEPEVPVVEEPEVPVEPEPEVPVDPEPEVPVVDEPEEEVITSSTIYTITITNETGSVITTLNVEEGSLITTSSLELPENFKGFFLDEQTCEDEPFDLETPITENLTLIQASFNDQAPCIQLDYIVLNGRPVAGTTLSVDVFPLGANVSISWYTSVNNRTYREIQGETESTFTVRPEDSGKFIRVYVVSESNPPVVRYDTIKLDVFGTVSTEQDNRIPLTAEELASSAAIIAAGSVPLAYPEDLFNIGTSVESLNQSYVLIRDIDLSVYSNLDSSFIDGTFTGNLSGQGFTISNLVINAPTGNEIGLFSQISGASISNLNLSNFDITGFNNSGLLIGLIKGGNNTISGITITQSSVHGEASVGGLVGGNEGDQLFISEIVNYANVTGGASAVGGLIGLTINKLTAFKVINHGAIHGQAQYNGGILGRVSEPSDVIMDEFGNFGTVISDSDGAGGIIGGSDTSTNNLILRNGFNFGDVSITTPKSNVGGIIGYVNNSYVTLSSIYSAGNVTTAGFRAGLIFGRFISASSNLSTSSGIYALDNLEVQDDGYTSISDNDNPYNLASVKLSRNNFLIINSFLNSSWNITNTSINSEIWSIGYNGDYTYPYLTFQGVPDEKQIISQNELTASDISTISILEKISEGYIPVASVHDLTAINSTNETTFAIGTEFETRTNGGLNKKYVMITNVAFADGVNGSAPVIAPSSTRFTGTFDGNNFTISNLDLSCTNCSTLALFGSIEDATIKNLVVSNIIININMTENIAGRRNAILIGQAYSSNSNRSIFENIKIINSTQITNTSSGNYDHGALIGQLFGSTRIHDIIISNLLSTGTGVFYQGGLIGRVNSSTPKELEIKNVSLSGMIVGGNRTGGLIGFFGTSSKWDVTIDNVNLNPHLFHIQTSQLYYGGLIGEIAPANSSQDYLNLEVRNSIISSNITTFESSGSRVGGLISQTRIGNYGLSITLSGVVYNGSIDASNNNRTNAADAGFIGELNNTGLSSIFIENSTFSGIITGSATTNIGGFFGSVSNSNHQIVGSGLTQSGNIINGRNNGHIIAEVSGTGPNINISNIFISPNSRDLKFIGGTFDSKYILDPTDSVTEELDGSISTNP